jgi:predicted lipoprotein with Yx(FWY)xxD motif
MRTKVLLVLLTAAAAGLIATSVSRAGGASKDSNVRATVRVTTRSVSGLGRILVNSRGMTLYMFVPDKRKRVTCHSTCAAIWPPLRLPHGAKLAAAGGVKPALLGSDRDPAGGRVVTYHGWPLYTYLGDRKPGVASGQALNLNGGLWYVLAPSGAVIRKKPHASTSSYASKTTTTATGTTPVLCSDDDADGDESSGGPDDGDGCV